ncbi:MAG: LysE family translocator [bacterium]|nr:LysE family translocator [bacterium]
MEFYSQLISLMGLMFLALICPGPDTIMVLRQFLRFGRTTAVYTSIGVGLGILVHITYCLLGIGLIISQSILVFSIMKIVGGLYLVFIGWLTIKSGPVSQVSEAKAARGQSSLRAIWIGFLTNSLNPKATFFFLSIFTVVISPATPLQNQVVFGIAMALETMVWFIFLSFSFSFFKVHKTVGWFSGGVNKLVGGLLMVLGVKLAISG